MIEERKDIYCRFRTKIFVIDHFVEEDYFQCSMSRRESWI